VYVCSGTTAPCPVLRATSVVGTLEFSYSEIVAHRRFKGPLKIRPWSRRAA
jgi:hypothetical protein